MSRAVLSLLLVCFAQVALAADLPPGAVARLGDDRFRAGGRVAYLALSPDGKQFATVRKTGEGMMEFAVWDSATGRPLREQEVNSELFKGVVWASGGAFAVFLRAEPGQDDRPGKLFPDDFHVWDFTDPKAAPPVLPIQASFTGSERVHAERPKGGAEYTSFVLSADGRRVAAAWRSADQKRHAIHVFYLKPADSATKLTRVGTADLGTEGADGFRLSTDGKTLVTFRTLANPSAHECTATAWDVAAGTPGKPVSVPRWYPHVPTLTPNGQELVDYVWTEKEWGYDLVELGTGKRRKLNRSPHAAVQDGEELLAAYSEIQPADSVFFPSHRVLVKPGAPTTIIDLTTGKELGRLVGHFCTPSAVAVSADGTRIATADQTGLIRLWDAKTLRPLNDAPGHRSPIEHAQLSPDGKRVLTWACDETIRVWDLATGKELRAFAGVPGVLSSWGVYGRPTFTPNGTAVLYGAKERLLARDIQTGLEVPLTGGLKKLPPRLAVFSPDGSSVLTWSVNRGGNGLCEAWDWPSGKNRFSWKTRGESLDPGFSPDGSVVFRHPISPERRDAKTGKELPPAQQKFHIDSAHPLCSLRASPSLLLLWNQDENASTLDISTGRPVSQFYFGKEFGFPVSSQPVALSPTAGQYAWATGYEPDGVDLYEAASCTARRTLAGHRGPGSRVLGFTPDGTKLLTAGGDHTVLVWDMRLQAVPLPDALKKETNAAKLWDMLAAGKADAAYLAMARLSREPDAALKLVQMKLKPAAKGERETDATRLTDARAVELLEALGTEGRALLKELAGGDAKAFRTEEAKRALERHR